MAQCTCGADQFEGAQHVQDCPAGKEPECTCGASAFPGAEHKPECISRLSDGAERYRPPASPQPQQNGPRRRVEDDNPGGSEFTNLKFFFGVPARAAQYYDGGKVAEIETGSVIGKLVDYREQATNYGECGFADLEILQGEFAGLLVSFICGTPPAPNDPSVRSSALCRLIRQVQKGETIEIIRDRDKGRMHVYTVDILG